MLKLAKNIILLALAGSLLASCASVLGPRDIDLPLHRLQASLDRRFPLNERLLELFQVELTRPELVLQHDSGRIGLVTDAAVSSPFARRPWRGNLALSGRLYLDPARNAVLMAEPRVDRFVVEGIDEARQRQLGKVANVLMEKLVADVPLYHFRPEDLRYGGVLFVPTRIATTARGLVVSLEPAP